MKKLPVVLLITAVTTTISTFAETNSVVLTTKDGHTLTVPIGKDGYIPYILEDGAIRISEKSVLLPTGQTDENGNIRFITIPYAAYMARKGEVNKGSAPAQTPYEECVDECMDSGLGDGDECSSQCADKEGS